MKRHEWHCVSVGLLGFLILVGYQNCGSIREEKATEQSDTVRTFSSIQCQVQDVSPYNQPSEINFSEDVRNIFDVYYNDVDCDSTIDALLISPENIDLSLTCFNYQQYGFGNCYPNTIPALLCGNDNPDCPITLRETNGQTIQDIYMHTVRGSKNTAGNSAN